MTKFNKKKEIVVAIKDGIVWGSYVPPGLELTVVHYPEDEESETEWNEAMQFIEENSNDD